MTAYQPDIGGLLPVFVVDRYEGFEVKAFPDLSEAELDRYVDANVAAVEEVVERAGGVDAALANHLVMGPAILARGGLEFVVKVHGSDLNYTVIPHLDRFGPYAREGVDAANGILVGSRHTADDLWGALDDPGLRQRTRLGAPGVDVDAFRPRSSEEALDELRLLQVEVAGESAEGAFGRDARAAALALEWWAEAPGPRIAFVGKLIVSKGIDLLAAAWPLVASENPGARLLVVAFGGYREGVERLLAALDAGEIEAAREVAARGRELEGGESGRLEMLDAFLANPPGGYAQSAKASAGSVTLAGRLEHGEVGRLLAAADAIVVPSTFPEAFGMVAAEAAACGALPVCADHSGLSEVAGALAAELPPPARDLVAFPLGDGAVSAIAERLNRLLSLDPGARKEIRDSLVKTVRERWSWERVAGGILAASAGRLEEVPRVPEPRGAEH